MLFCSIKMLSYIPWQIALFQIALQKKRILSEEHFAKNIGGIFLDISKCSQCQCNQGVHLEAKYVPQMVEIP